MTTSSVHVSSGNSSFSFHTNFSMQTLGIHRGHRSLYGSNLDVLKVGPSSEFRVLFNSSLLAHLWRIYFFKEWVFINQLWLWVKNEDLAKWNSLFCLLPYSESFLFVWGNRLGLSYHIIIFTSIFDVFIKVICNWNFQIEKGINRELIWFKFQLKQG